MTEETKHHEKKEDTKIVETPKHEVKHDIHESTKHEIHETKHEAHESKHETNVAKQENKTEEKAIPPAKTPKSTPAKIQKKEAAIAKGHSMPVSKRQCMYISAFIKNKKIDLAISDLKEVIKFKKIVHFKGEIPHRKGKGMMSGRYPIKASALFIKLLKGLRGNALVNGLDLEKTRIVSSSSNWASRPMRGQGRKGKRTHVLIKAMEMKEE